MEQGAAVRVVVRCRPPSAAAAAPAGEEPCLEITAEADPIGREKATQEELFAESRALVEGLMDGFSGAILCYGATGAGKTYTMTGPPEEIGSRQREERTLGIAQRVSRSVFEYIRDRSANGEVFAVEASFLQVYSEDDSRELLSDLLSEDDATLEVKQDSTNCQSFSCHGLRRVPIRTPDELCEVLNEGQQRSEFLETTKNKYSSRAHCLLTLTVESLSEGRSGRIVQRGKLMLVDLAGSEPLAGAEATDGDSEALRKRQASGISRVLSALGSVANGVSPGSPSGHGDSAVTMLLRDCLGGGARALLVANIGPELAGLEESAKTMTFAQKMMSVRNVASRNKVAQDQSSLLQLQKRQTECIRILREEQRENRELELEAREKLQQEMEDLNKRLLTKDSAQKALEDLRDLQQRRLDELGFEVEQAMSSIAERQRLQTQQELEKMRQTMKEHVVHLDSAHQQKQVKDQEARVSTMTQELAEAQQGRKTCEDEATELRVRLASSEERARMLQTRLEEFRRERTEFEDERRESRQRSEQQWQKLMQTESDLQRCRAEVEAQKAELARLSAAQAEEADGARREREAWTTREGSQQRQVSDLRQKVEAAKREAEVQALRQESDLRETAETLRVQVERLEAEANSRAEQLREARCACVGLEAEKAAANQREEALRQQGDFELRRVQEEFAHAKAREAELMHMLKEVQNSIIESGIGGPGPGAVGVGGAA